MPKESSCLFADWSVWLVGAGPGDPDLVTRKAERLLRAKADVILLDDALVGQRASSISPRPQSGKLVGVGKRSVSHSKDQKGTIDQLIIAAAHEGQRVLRLKGGDPSIFGRWLWRNWRPPKLRMAFPCTSAPALRQPAQRRQVAL